MNSTTASTVKMTTVHCEPMKASGELWRLIQPKRAAHATTAGAVRERSPATTPIPNVSNSVVEFIDLLQIHQAVEIGPGTQLLELVGARQRQPHLESCVARLGMNLNATAMF